MPRQQIGLGPTPAPSTAEDHAAGRVRGYRAYSCLHAVTYRDDGDRYSLRPPDDVVCRGSLRRCCCSAAGCNPLSSGMSSPSDTPRRAGDVEPTRRTCLSRMGWNVPIGSLVTAQVTWGRLCRRRRTGRRDLLSPSNQRRVARLTLLGARGRHRPLPSETQAPESPWLSMVDHGPSSCGRLRRSTHPCSPCVVRRSRAPSQLLRATNSLTSQPEKIGPDPVVQKMA